MKFKIKKGKSKMGPFYKRLWYNMKSGVIDIGGDMKRRCSVDFGDCKKGVSIKLTGMAAVAPFSLNRLKYNKGSDIQELFEVAHEQSDRIVCINRGDTIGIFTYAYRGGKGLSSPKKYRDQDYDYMKPVGEVKQGEPFNIRITTLSKHTRYVFWKNNEFGHDRNVVYMGNNKRSAINWIMTAHAAGAHGPVAPEDIKIKIKNI